jgi:hypothetical protein
MAAHSFTLNAPLPVRLRPQARVPAPRVFWADEFRYDEHARFYDYFLLRDPSGRHNAGSFGGPVDEMFHGGAWRVYRRPYDFEPRPIPLAPPPPAPGQ